MSCDLLRAEAGLRTSFFLSIKSKTIQFKYICHSCCILY
jgi:hypothetical protein